VHQPAPRHRFDHGRINADHGVKDRHPHKQGEQVDVSHDDSKIRKQSKRQRLVDATQRHLRLIENAVQPEKRHPRNHAQALECTIMIWAVPSRP
jgi:hypothetical protein